MREILFKAKRTDNGEWVEGNLVTRKYADTDKVFEAHIVVDAYEQMGVLNYGMYPVLISPVTTDEFEECCFKVDYNTICQYTGLTDKNGNKIWENDIVSHEYTKIISDISGELPFDTVREQKNYVIKWDSSDSYMGYRYHNGRNIFPFKKGTVINGSDEVIGNIFDNPELLERR